MAPCNHAGWKWPAAIGAESYRRMFRRTMTRQTSPARCWRSGEASACSNSSTSFLHTSQSKAWPSASACTLNSWHIITDTLQMVLHPITCMNFSHMAGHQLKVVASDLYTSAPIMHPSCCHAAEPLDHFRQGSYMRFCTVQDTQETPTALSPRGRGQEWLPRHITQAVRQAQSGRQYGPCAHRGRCTCCRMPRFSMSDMRGSCMAWSCTARFVSENVRAMQQQPPLNWALCACQGQTPLPTGIPDDP